VHEIKKTFVLPAVVVQCQVTHLWMGPRSLLYDDGIGLLASKHIVCTPWLLCVLLCHVLILPRKWNVWKLLQWKRRNMYH